MSCCVCSLGTSTLIFGILGLIGSVGGIIGGVFGLATMERFYYDLSIKMEVDKYVVYLGGSLIHLITSILLILSVKQRMSNMAIPWLVETALAIVACFCSSILLAKFVPMAPILLLSSVLSVYFWLAVLRFHCELKLEEQNKQSARANENINMESVNMNIISGIV